MNHLERRGWRGGAEFGKAAAWAQSNSSAAGVVIALSVMIGAIAGGLKGQPSIGFLAGLAIGSLLALGYWWMKR